MMTPDLPAFAPLFAQQLQQLRTDTQAALHQFQALFEPWIPHYRLAQQDEGPHSRNRRWNLRLVFWTFLWQIAQAGTPAARRSARPKPGAAMRDALPHRTRIAQIGRAHV